MIASHHTPVVPEICWDPGSGLRWSHEALQDPLIYRRVRHKTFEDRQTLGRHLALADQAERAAERGDLVSADRLAGLAERSGRKLEDNQQPATILIREGNGVFAQLPPLTLQTVAAWLDTTADATDPQHLERLLSPTALDRYRDVLQRVVSLDHQTETPSATVDRCLSAALNEGLQRHEGRHLLGNELAPYVHLLARGYQPTGLRVCEQCQLVHPAPRARTCNRAAKARRAPCQNRGTRQS